MIKKPTKPSRNFVLFLSVSFAIPLSIFFIYAFFWQTRFFLYLQVFLSLQLIYLMMLRLRLIRRKAEVDLQKQNYIERANLLQAEIEKEWQVIESYREKIRNYSELKGLTERLCLSLSLQDTSRVLSSEVSKLFGDREVTVILYLFHSRTGELGLSSSQRGQMRVNIKEKKGDVYDQWAIKMLKPLLVADTKKDFRFDADKITTADELAVYSLMSVPLMVGHKALGILRVDSPKENYFTTEDIRFLTTIADLGAVAIENAQLYERVEDLAIHDGLTGLFLQRYFLARLNHEISRELRRKKELSLLMIDLDEFKKYNDHYGHTAGDIVLRTVALLLQEVFHLPGTLICRYGGEEFSVLLPDCPKEKAMELAEALRKKIEEQTIILRRQKTHITVSVGVATFPRDAQIKEELIQQADQALYQAKKKGRNKVYGA